MTEQRCPNCGQWMVERDDMLFTCPKCDDTLDLRYGVNPPFDVPDLAEIDVQNALDRIWRGYMEAVRIPKETLDRLLGEE